MRELGASALRLVRAPLGPLFDLEVRSAGRRRTTYLVRAGYALLLLFVVGVALAGLLEDASHQGPAARLQALAGVAPTLTMVIGWLQFIVLTQMAPVLTAAAICNEKQQRTLPALATTPLSAGQIVLGKLAGRLMQMLILVLASLPALLAVRWLGGLAAEPVVAVTALTISSMLFSGSLGMLVALRCKRARTAAALTMATVVLLYLSPLLLLALGVNIFGFQPSGWWFVHAAKVDPAIAMGMVTAGVMNPAMGAAGLTTTWLYPSLAAVGGAGVCCAIAAAGLRRTIREEVGGAPKRGRAARKAAKAQAKSRRSRTVGERVLLWREQRFGRLLASRLARTSAVVIGLGLATIYTFGGTDVTGFHIAIGIIGGAASLFAASQATVGAIAGERESRTWDVLIATPLSARTILYQKFLGSLWRVAIGPALLTLHFLVFGVIGVTHPLGALHVGAIVFGFCVFLAGTGVLFSLLVRKSAVAGALNIGLAIGLWIGVPLALAFILGAVLQVGEDVFEPVATVGVFAHPGFMLINGVLMAAENGSALDSGVTVASGAYGSIVRLDALGPVVFTAFYLASSIGAAAVGVGAVETAVRVFPKRGGRA